MEVKTRLIDGTGKRYGLPDGSKIGDVLNGTDDETAWFSRPDGTYVRITEYDDGRDFEMIDVPAENMEVRIKDNAESEDSGTAKKKAENRLTAFMLTSKFSPEYFSGWDEKGMKAVTDGNTWDIGMTVIERLENAGGTITNAYAITHDRDMKSEWDEHTNSSVVVPSDPHFHLIVKFDKRAFTLDELADIIGIEKRQIEKPKAGRYAWDNMCAYLIHVKYVNKTQYSPDDVITIVGTKYMDIYNDRAGTWERGRSKVTSAQTNEDIDWLIDEISVGNISRRRLLTDTALRPMYVRNKRKCDDAYTVYIESRVERALMAFENGEFKCTIYYITGPARIGKSYFARGFCKELIDDVYKRTGDRWTVFHAAPSHPVDGYDGSEIVLIDDLRGESMSASDWLLLLDPERASSRMSARYHNVAVPARVIVIVAYQPVHEFFYYLKSMGKRSESLGQFFGRVMSCVKILKCDDGERKAIVGNSRELSAPVSYDVSAVKGNDNVVGVNWDFGGDEQLYSADDARKRMIFTVYDRCSIEHEPLDIKPSGTIPLSERLSNDKPYSENKDGPGEENEYFDENYQPSQKLLDMEREQEEQITNENGDPIF